MHLAPLFTKVRFRPWSDVLAEPAPPDDRPTWFATWHAARGLAHAAEGRLDEAEKGARGPRGIKNDAALKMLGVSSVKRPPRALSPSRTKCWRENWARRRNRATEAGGISLPPSHSRMVDVYGTARLADPCPSIQGAALLAIRTGERSRDRVRRRPEEVPTQGWSLSGLQASLERPRPHARSGGGVRAVRSELADRIGN